LVTDIRLVGSKLKGWDIARQAREQHPQLPVLYLTADGAPDWKREGVPGSALVAKPFVETEVVAALSRLLNTSR
jgi:DNA-binding response OmpR family regulator